MMNQKPGPSEGFLDKLLHGSKSSRGLFNDIVSGNNGANHARFVWHACAGWGSSIGARLSQLLGP
jgi:hypothetical protein